MFWHIISILWLLSVNLVLIILKNNPYFNIQITRYFFGSNYKNGLGLQNQKFHWLFGLAFFGVEFKLFLNTIHESDALYLIDSGIDTYLSVAIMALFIIQIVLYMILKDSDVKIINFRGYRLDEMSNQNTTEHELLVFLNRIANHSQIESFKIKILNTIEEVNSIKSFLKSKYPGLEIGIKNSYPLDLTLKDSSCLNEKELKLPISIDINANPKSRSLSNYLAITCCVYVKIYDYCKFDFYIKLGDEKVEVSNFKLLFEQTISEYWPELLEGLNQVKTNSD